MRRPECRNIVNEEANSCPPCGIPATEIIDALMRQKVAGPVVLPKSPIVALLAMALI